MFTAFALSLIAMVFLFSAPVMAQATTGRLTGTVVDPNGGVVAGTTVTAKNDATGAEKQFTTGADGGFVISELQPGKYTVSAAPASGFSTKVLTGVDVKVGEATDLKVALEVGQPSAVVTITANTEEVMQTTSQQSSSFETRKVEDLPSNAAGGGIDTLALLAPGVVPGFGNVNGNGVTLSVNGNRARSNNFTLDGTDNNDLSVGGPSFFVDNQDAVQEFQIITNNFSAQYGRNLGAVVNIITKGGTNEFHGSGFEFHRNSSSLDAMTNDERADPTRSRRDKFVSNVFGGTFGGPIIKNKAFFFVDGQLIRQRQTFGFSTTAPVITAPGLASLAAAFPGNPAIAVLVNQSLAALQPNARVATSAGTVCFPLDFNLACSGANALLVPAAFMKWTLPLPFNQKEYGLRGDFNPTNKDSFNVKYRYQQSPETGFNSQSNGFFGDIPFTSKDLNGAWTRTFSSHFTNEFKAAWQKLAVTFGGCTGVTDPLKGCIPNTTLIDKAFTNVSLSGIRAAGVSLQTIGPATNVPQGRTVSVTQFADNLSWVRGKHSMIMGIDYRRLGNSVPFLPNINGAFRFSTTARLVANSPTSVILVGGQPTIKYKEQDQFYFFQDNWKFRENLTLELGVRYENTGQPINTLHDISLATETNPTTALWLQSIPLAQRTFPKIPVDKNNFAPRLGFAWSPRMGDGRFSKMLFGDRDATVVRAGYSVAYDPAFYNILLNVSTSSPIVFNNQVINTGTNAAPLFRIPANPTGDVVRSALGAFLQKNTFDPRFFTQTSVGSDFHSPMAQQWSFSIQRQINRNNVAEVRYVGNHGSGLFQSINRNPFIATLFNGIPDFGFGAFPAFKNLLPAGATPQVCVDNTATPGVNEGICNGRLLPQGLLRTRENTATSDYHGLQARYNGRVFNQLTVGAAYTFSKTIDNASEIFSFGEGAFAQNPFNVTNGERGLSGNDRRHASAFNFIWDVPMYKSEKGLIGHALGGWQLNGTYNLASGRPFTPSQFCNFACVGIDYQDDGFQGNFVGLDQLRPFWGNPKAPRTAIGITATDTGLLFVGDVVAPSPTGLYSLNALNTSCHPDGTGCNLVPVTVKDVRFIFNGIGAARQFGTPYGDVGRNVERGPALNQLNIGIFKNTKIRENVRLQLRAELFNALNHPNPGFGVAGGDSLPDTTVEDAGNIPAPAAFNAFNDKRAISLSSRRIQFGIRLTF